MINAFTPLPDCSHLPQDAIGHCLRDIHKIGSCRAYFVVACINAIFVIVTTALYMYYAWSASAVFSDFDMAIPLDQSRRKLSRRWIRNSLQKRSIFGTVLGAAGHLVFTTDILVSQSFYSDGRCDVMLWGVVIGFFSWTFAFCWRAYRLYFLIKLNSLKTRFSELTLPRNAPRNNPSELIGGSVEDREYLWFMRNKDCHQIKSTRPLCVYCISLAVVAVVCVIVEIYEFRARRNCQDRYGVFVLTGFIAVFFTIIAPFILWNIRNVRDGHGIRNEIAIDVVTGIPCFILMLVWFAVHGELKLSVSGSYYRTYFAPANWMAIFTTIAHITAIVAPLCRLMPVLRNQGRFASAPDVTYQDAVTQHTHHLSNGRPTIVARRVSYLRHTPDSLRVVLSTPELLDVLIELAVEDFSSENVLFYKRYLELLDMTKVRQGIIDDACSGTPSLPDREKRDTLLYTPLDEDLVAEFTEFYNTYIRDSAPLQVNISYRARLPLDAFFGRAARQYVRQLKFGMTPSSSEKKNVVKPLCRRRSTDISSTLTAFDPTLESNRVTPRRVADFQKRCIVLRQLPPIIPSPEITPEITDENTSLSIESDMGSDENTPLTLEMFEDTRKEVFWNIFASVFSKFLSRMNHQ